MIPTKVFNMKSNKGRNVPNQFLITTNEGFYFQSYQTTIAFRDNKNQVYLDYNDWDYSVTTGRYRNQFLNEGIAETRRKIKEGIYILKDLNKPSYKL